MIKQKLEAILKEILEDFDLPSDKLQLDHPTREEYGDYSTNIALQLTNYDQHPLCQSPQTIARAIRDKLEEKGVGQNELAFLVKVEVAGPGFINFYLSQRYLLSFAQELAQARFNYPAYAFGKQGKVMIEFAHPNTHKQFHIGHLRTAILGESLSRLLGTLGNQVIRVNYQGDVGLHIAKCMYGVLESRKDLNQLETLPEKINFLSKAYVAGSRAYEKDKKAKEEIVSLNKKIYEKDRDIFPLVTQTRQWSLDYFDAIYQRLDTKFDRLYFESEVVRGADIAKEAFKKGLLIESEGAIIFPGERYGLDRRVFINSQGLPTYEAKELKLAELEFSEFGEIDKCIHVVGPEQTSFFKVTFKVEELLDPDKYKDRQQHLVYGWVRLKTGKMSSREGTVIEANWLLDRVKKGIMERHHTTEKTAEVITSGAVKYSMLKIGIQNELLFDTDESISLEGDSGPYLLYTYARTQGVLAKTDPADFRDLANPEDLELTQEERDLFSWLSRFSSVVFEVGKNFAPNLLCSYLFDLSQKFNLFYQKSPILKAEGSQRQLRLLLTSATAQVINEGLHLLGIKTLRRM